MTALLDTHALRWWFDGSTNLPADIRNLISDRSATIVISVVVPWELAMKTRLGQLDASVLLTRWMEIVELQGFSELAVGSDHAIRAGLLPLHHRDPFDRLLVAQAQATGWPIISGDRVFDQYGVRRTW